LERKKERNYKKERRKKERKKERKNMTEIIKNEMFKILQS
jgi:hypothetical protein